MAKMLACGNPAKMGSIEYRCLHCGQGQHVVAMSCKSSLCLRCAKVYVDNWVSQVSERLHAGVIYRHIILTVPAMFRTTFYHNAALLLSALMRCGVQCLELHGRPSMYSLRVRSVPLFRSSQRLEAFAFSSHPGVRGFPALRLLCPFRLPRKASDFHTALAFLLPPSLPSFLGSPVFPR